jgi:ATP/maltotriose-dependent transcriptional regulator MalT
MRFVPRPSSRPAYSPSGGATTRPPWLCISAASASLWNWQSGAIALALTGLARVELRRDIERARTLCLEALEVVDGTGDQRGRSSALHVLGVAAQMRGQFPEARGWMSQRLELAREMGDLRSVAAEAGNLSVVEQHLGDLSRARDRP